LYRFVATAHSPNPDRARFVLAKNVERSVPVETGHF
jgi:hypothetical protein